MSKEAASTTKFQAWAHGFGIGRVNKGLVSWHQHGAFGVPLGHVQIARSQTSSEFLRDIMSGLMQLPNWLYMPWIGFQNWGLPAIRQKLGTYVSSSAWPRQMIRAIVRPSRSINTPFPSISSTQVTVDPHKNLLNDHHMAMDQYLLIPFLVGWTSIYQLFWGSLGTRVLTHPQIIKILCFPGSRLEQLMLTEALTELRQIQLPELAPIPWHAAFNWRNGARRPDVGWWQISRIFQSKCVIWSFLVLACFGVVTLAVCNFHPFSRPSNWSKSPQSNQSRVGKICTGCLANHLIKTCCRRCWVSKKMLHVFFGYKTPKIIKPHMAGWFGPGWLRSLPACSRTSLGTSGSCVTNLPSAWLGMVKKAPIKIDKIWKNGVTIIIGGKYETIKMENIGFTNGLPHSLCWNVGHHGLLASAPGS